MDWNEVSDFELFLMLYPGIDEKVSKLFFGDLNWKDFELSKKISFEEKEDDIENISDDSKSEEKIQFCLYNEKEDIEINEDVYNHISQYLRSVFNIYPEEKLTNNSVMKKWFIEKDLRQLNIDKEKAKNGKMDGNSIQSIISACVNHPGFKYKLRELRDVGICEFYDSVKRLQVYESTTALMKGMYSGFMDSSKIKAEDYNFMQDIKR